MVTVCSQEMIIIPVNTKRVRKPDNASSSISTHTALAAVGVVIFHFKIIAWIISQDHQTISPDSKSPVTKFCDLILVKLWHFFPAIHNDEIISCSLVLI